MKKYLVTILIVLSMLAMFAGTASAAANVEFWAVLGRATV